MKVLVVGGAGYIGSITAKELVKKNQEVIIYDSFENGYQEAVREFDSIKGNIKDEDKIALAAKISGKISELCEILSDRDPMEYARVCKTDDDAPEWKKDLDKKLTKEQKKRS